MNLGCKQKLKCVKEVDFGIYLAENDEERVLLPKKQVPAEVKIGDELEVFLYKDSKDRLICTTNEPKITLGEVAFLEVLEVGRIGAFLDWGLEKDLLLPYKEQVAKIKEGDVIPVALYIDKSSRLCATMKVYPYLKKNSPYNKEDRVKGFVYDTSENYGTYVIIDGCFSGRIPPHEFNPSLKYGDMIEARVTAVKEDGKLDLSIREKSYIQIDADAEKIKELIDNNNGILKLNDKSDSKLIREITGLSKNAFKRAVGRLLKNGYIEFKDDYIVKK